MENGENVLNHTFLDKMLILDTDEGANPIEESVEVNHSSFFFFIFFFLNK